jgi:hypothetical protein
MNHYAQETELRPRLWFFPLIFLPAVASFIYMYNRETDSRMLAPLFIAVFIFAFAVFALAKSRIYFNDQGIGYRSLFRKGFMNWSDIRNSYLKYKHRGKSGSFVWVLEDAAGKKMALPMGLHSRANYRSIAETLRAKSPNATLEPRILQMSEGIFRWYIF